jgi:hypothetical protein
MISVALALIFYTLFRENVAKDEGEEIQDMFKVMLAACTLAIQILLFRRYSLTLRRLKLFALVDIDTWLFQCPLLLKKMCTEFVLCIAFFPPYMSYKFTMDCQTECITYLLMDFLIIWILVRLYQLPRSLKFYTFYTTPSALRFMSLFSLVPNTAFIFKSARARSPLMVTIVLTMLSVFVLGWGLEILERDSLGVFLSESIYDKFWLMVISTTTTGFGDVFVTSTLGKVFVLTDCVLGSIIGSICIYVA